MFNENYLNKLLKEMPTIIFSEKSNPYLYDELFQKYLNFYNINFHDNDKKISHNFGFFESDNKKIMTHVWRPGKTIATLFLLHGYTDNVGLMRHAIKNFLDQNYAVVAFDLPGHGLSEGKRANIESFDEYVNVLEECLSLADGALTKPWLAAGQSTGGAIWLNYLGRHPQQKVITTTVLFAPLIRIAAWSKLRFIFPFYKMFKNKKIREFKVNSSDESFLKFVREKDLLQPKWLPFSWVSAMKKWIKTFSKYPVNQHKICVISGGLESTVDADYNLKKIKEKFPSARINVFPGVGHQVVNESEAHREKIFSTVNEYLKEFV